MKKSIQLIGTIVLCQLAGIIGALFTTSQIEGWYALLDKPFFQPPSWVFGPVWTVLYTMMGIALFLIIQSPTSGKSKVYISFGMQLVVNTLWTLVFFGAHQVGTALAVIIVLLASIVWTMWEMRSHSTIAMWLMAPYLSWVLFASVLNAAVFVLN